MTFMRKTLLAVLSVAATCSSLLAASCKTDRIVCAQQERLATTPFNPFDSGHQGMLGLGFFDQDDVDEMVATAITKFRLAYGIDFGGSNVVVLSNGVRVIPGVAQMIPYINNPPDQDYYVTVDTENPERVGKWIQVSVGRLVIFNAVTPPETCVPCAPCTATIANDPLVPNSGAIYEGNNNWFYGYNIMLKKGADWSKKKNRELFTSTSYQLGLLFPNQWNDTEILVTLTVEDKNKNEGLCIAPTANLTIPQNINGTPFAQNLNYYRWVKNSGLDKKKVKHKVK